MFFEQLIFNLTYKYFFDKNSVFRLLTSKHIIMNIFFQIKRFFLTILVVIISLHCVFGQSEEKTKKPKKEIFTFGPKASLSFTNDSEGIPGKYKVGTDFGLFFRISPSRFYIQPEFYYQIRSADIVNHSGHCSYIENHKSHHLDIPLLIGIKAVDFKLFKIRFFLGPYFSFKIADSLKNYYSHSYFQLGFQTGLGVDLWRFTIDVSYSNLNSLNYKFWIRGNNIFKVGVGFKCF